MNRRHFISATAAACASSAVAGEKDALPKNAGYRIVMVDPRLVTKTNDTQPVGYERKRSDVMGSVYLSYEEWVKLKGMLSTALTSSDNVPLCGHSPAYVIVETNRGKARSGYFSVCGLCKTWCGPAGELRVLDDAQLMPFLTKVLPLPAAFSKVKELPDLMALDREKSFLELPSPA